ncbi:hypothetical protein [Clostridium felsineum]|uniref:hypothetical protein n=1 Tax=Clostridium felsineum TaxID=36839 RepID=UPI00098CE334|nr:hypothetical protein [Clostridium felsineum]URZ02043.1 hypothetical protein CLAUR_020400 [Clostridium felsineum]
MIDLTNPSTVNIGRRGEHHFRNIEFDVSSLLGDDYPSASLQAIYKRPDGTAYPVVTSYADGVLIWSPSATDTLDAGVGQLEIRVVVSDVVGKSVKVLTIVEEALVDGIVTPPEPPAQEWLNQVLAALAALDVNDVYSLLSLTYDLLNTTYDKLNDTYGLLNTTHDLVEETRDNLYKRTGILLNHMHPIETATAPDMTSRRASITFTGIANGNNVVIGTVTYTFVTVLGSPVTNNVQVLIQGTLCETVQKLAEATRGSQDELNIAYGTETGANPFCTTYWTSQRFSMGDTTVNSGESLFVLERAENVTAALPFTTTAAATINGFSRTSFLRYILSGNALGTGGINSVRGPLHTVLPIGSVVIGGQGGPLHPETTYDCHLLTLCRQSDTSEKELDLYISNDEINFTRISRSTPVGFSSTGDATHVHIELRQSRIPTGYGLYISMGSNGTSSSAYCDLKFTYHLYPISLATDNLFE